MQLLKSQKLDLLKMIDGSGMPRSAFEIVFVEAASEYERDETNVKYGRTEYRFSVSHDPQGGFYLGIVPAEQRPYAGVDASTWYECTKLFGQWLTYVQREVDAEAELFPAVHDLPPIEDDPNTPLSDLERESLNSELLHFAAEVGKRFDAMKSDVGDVHEKLSAIQAQQDHILRELEYLRDASGRLGKKDWSLAAIGLVASVSAGAALPPEVVRQLLVTLLQTIGNAKLLGS